MSDELSTGGEVASAESSAPESSGELSTESAELSAEDGALAEESSEESSEGSSLSDGESQIEVSAENDQQFQEEVEQAIEDGASEEQVKDMIRQYTLNVKGKTIVKELDKNDDEKIQQILQREAAGQMAMQELAELKKVYTNEIERLLNDPFSVMQELNPDFDPMDHVKRFVEDRYQESQLSPEQKAAREREIAYQTAMKENQALKQRIADQEMQQELEKLEIEIENDIISAIESDNELELDEDTIALVAENLIWAEDNGFEGYKAKDVLPTVKEQLREQFRNATKKFKSTAALKEYMGQDLLNKLREERIQQAKKQINSVSNIKSDAVAPKQEEASIKEERIPLSSLFK
jgi:hypothetical protein